MPDKPGPSGPPKPPLKATLPSMLGKPMSPFTKLRGASPFAVALTNATPEQVAKAREIAGGPEPITYLKYYQVTGNPIWLWIVLALSQDRAIPKEVVNYLRACANRVFGEVVAHVSELERVKMEEGKSLEEGITRQPPRRLQPTNIAQIFELAHTGRNTIQEAAKDLRSVSMAVAAEDLVRNKGNTFNEAYALLATLNGRGSAAGPAVATMRQIVDRGRRLLGFLPNRKS